MKIVDKIIFNDKEYYKVYNGYELLFEVKKEVELEYLTFTALEQSTILYNPSEVTTSQYSYDKVNWETADNVTLNLNTGDKVYFKGKIVGSNTTSSSAHFTMTGKISASGSIMSLQEGIPQDNTIKYGYEFYKLFYNCTSLVTAPELPATTLMPYCYTRMFESCENLVNAPDLTSSTLRAECYSYMFTNCTSLTQAPELKAMKLEYRCYAGMFDGCTSLTNAPELPSTMLDMQCYHTMFQGCISLTKAPVLPATLLIDGCYYGMFRDCSNLNYVKCDAMEYISSNFNTWLRNVSPTGDFYCYDSSIFKRGNSGIPKGWTVHSEI